MRDLYQTILDEAYREGIEIPAKLLPILQRNLGQSVPLSPMSVALGKSAVNVACTMLDSYTVAFIYREERGYSRYACFIRTGETGSIALKAASSYLSVLNQKLYDLFEINMKSAIWFPFEFYADQRVLSTMKETPIV